MTDDTARLVYLVHTMAWMGGHKAWEPDVIAEQLTQSDDPRVLHDLGLAVNAGLVAEVADGYCLSEAGWLLAASAAT